MKKESDPNAKYELFQRLNTGGSQLSDQEVRNCLILMANKDFYKLLIELDSYQNYKNCLPITDRKTDERYTLELLLKLIIAEYIDWNSINSYSDLYELLNKETLLLCDKQLNYDDIKDKFIKTFGLLDSIFGEDTFRRFNGTKHIGPVLSSAFQAIAVGVYHSIESILEKKDKENWLKEKINSVYENDSFKTNSLQGVKPITRYKDLSLFSINYFKL
jgi:hypothetical protein